MDIQKELLKIATEIEGYQKNAKTKCRECGDEMPGVFPGLCRDCKQSLYLQRLRYAKTAGIVPRCPYCESRDMRETGKFDNTVIDAEECRHDFECDDCGGLFSIVFHPIDIIEVQAPEPEEDED